MDNKAAFDATGRKNLGSGFFWRGSGSSFLSCQQRKTGEEEALGKCFEIHE
jgi:hypothetical protein